jgi:hypothetical protein
MGSTTLAGADLDQPSRSTRTLLSTTAEIKADGEQQQ